MKQIAKFFALAIVMIAFSISTFAQATATASATIITPIGILKTVDMNFGNVVTSAAAGTVVLTPAGTRSTTLGASIIPAQPGTVTAATFTVSGSAGLTYSITLPASVTINNGVPSMTVDTFISNPAAGVGTGTIGGGGTQTLTVGATLNVGANQAPGFYTSAAPFTVTVNYN
jgi:hypothetical protein